MGNNKLYICRGIVGAGKSFTIRQLVDKENIFSTDDFWGDDYAFDASKLGIAHDWNKKRTEVAMVAGKSPIAVDNTNITWKEIKPYAALAVKYKYDLVYIESSSPWWTDFNSSFPLSQEDVDKFANIFSQKNTHNVPMETIRRMISRWVPSENLPKNFDKTLI